MKECYIPVKESIEKLFFYFQETYVIDYKLWDKTSFLSYKVYFEGKDLVFYILKDGEGWKVFDETAMSDEEGLKMNEYDEEKVKIFFEDYFDHFYKKNRLQNLFDKKTIENSHHFFNKYMHLLVMNYHKEEKMFQLKEKVYQQLLKECTPREIEMRIMKQMGKENYGQFVSDTFDDQTLIFIKIAEVYFVIEIEMEIKSEVSTFTDLREAKNVYKKRAKALNDKKIERLLQEII